MPSVPKLATMASQPLCIPAVATRKKKRELVATRASFTVFSKEVGRLFAFGYAVESCQEIAKCQANQVFTSEIMAMVCCGSE